MTCSDIAARSLKAAVFSPAQVTHEPHFCLLREVVSFSGGSRGRPSREVLENPCQESFILFQIGLLREYLELEFRNDALPFAYDVERVIDDFVLFCMLIGNDFLPGMIGSLLVAPCCVMASMTCCRLYQRGMANQAGNMHALLWRSVQYCVNQQAQQQEPFMLL